LRIISPLGRAACCRSGLSKRRRRALLGVVARLGTDTKHGPSAPGDRNSYDRVEASQNFPDGDNGGGCFFAEMTKTRNVWNWKDSIDHGRNPFPSSVHPLPTFVLSARENFSCGNDLNERAHLGTLPATSPRGRSEFIRADLRDPRHWRAPRCR